MNHLFTSSTIQALKGRVFLNYLQTILQGSLVLLALLAARPDCQAQTTYYVAADGNDANDGRSEGNPLQTLAKVNGLKLRAGDQVLFRRGDTFRGTLTIRESGSSGQPIVFDAYGSGVRPTLSASVPVTGWSNVGGNVWQATCSSCGNRLTGLYRAGNDLPLSRYPNYASSNKGYLTIQSHQNRQQLTSQQGIGINLNTGWSGTEVVIRANQWIIDRYNFNSQSGNTLYLSGTPSGYPINDNWGFFVQNHPAALDQNGEWAFNTSSKAIRLYSTQGNPNDQAITATVQDYVVNLKNASYVTLRNLRLAESLSVGLLVDKGSNLTFSDVEVINSGENGVQIAGSGNAILMENSRIYSANNNGFEIDAYQNVVFRGNSVRRIGVVPGRGNSADGQYNGISSEVNQNLVMEDNVVDSIGYNGISFATNTVIRRNVVTNFCIAKSDGGGIYTWNGNGSRAGSMQILANIVSNSIGAPEGTPGGAYSGANGIYLDDCTLNAQVNDNTVFNCNGFGIYLHATNGASLNNNTVYNNVEAQLAILPAGGCSARNNNILNNILVSRLPDQLVGKYESNQNDVAQYGNFDYNYYLRPWEDEQKIRVIYNNGGYTGGHLTLTQWQNLYGKDRNSKNSPITYSTSTQPPDENIRLVVNPTSQNLVVAIGGTYRDPKGKAYSGSVTLAPFTSLVLLRDLGAAPAPTTLREPENPAGAVAGLDYSYYEGSWSALPDFNALTPVKSGTVGSVTLTPRNRDGQYGMRFTGYVNVPADGTYTFYTTSDDGTKLWIGSTEVVNNDGAHGSQERSGVIGLKAGRHAVTVVYFQGGGGQELSVSYSSQGLGKQVIPASAFYRVGNGTPTPPPPPPSTTTLREPENPAGAVAGLDYRYYEGTWTSLPDFNVLTPVITSTVSTIDLSQRKRDDNFGARFTGYIDVPTDGQYTFYTNSDDGSKLYIGDTEVVNNDGTHAAQERSGMIGLKAGRHALTVLFFEYNNGHELRVSYSGPNVGKQVIPASAFYRVGNGTPTPPPATNPTTLREPENPAGALGGLDYSYYEGTWTSLPDFNRLASVKIGTVNTIDLSVRKRDNNFGIRFTGYIDVPTDGQYTFYTNSDDGSKLYIGDTEVVNNDGTHAAQERSGMIGLKAGRHALTILFFEYNNGEELSVSYSGPGLGKQIIPASAFYRVVNSTPIPPSMTLREPENPAGTVAGLDYRYYEGNWTTLPNFNALTPVRTGTAGVPDISMSPQVNFFGLRFTGYINVPNDGVYTFYVSSDDGSKLYIGDTEVVNHDGTHPQTEKSGTIGLKAGKHAFTLLYFENAGGEGLSVSYSGPDVSKQVIAASAFYRVGNSTTPPPTTALREPENPAGAVAGLDYRYYEGGWWGQLPDFNAMTPVKTGTTNNVDLSVRNRNDRFGLRFTGYVNVPADGQYTFYTNSDDGSKLLIGSTEVVNNDGGHVARERQGMIGLKAGRHALTVLYYEDSGNEELSISYSGPNLNKQTVPASAFFRVENQPNTNSASVDVGISEGTGTGLRAEYFSNMTLTGPSVFTRIEPKIDWGWGDDSPAPGQIGNDKYSTRWTGQVEAPVDGNFTFTTLSDDGVQLWVNNQLIISNWNKHALATNHGSITLKGGQKYDIRLEYYEDGGGAEIRLKWSYPGQAQQTVPQQRLYPAGGSGRIGAAGTAQTYDETSLEVDASVLVYPVPAREVVRVRYTALAAGTVTLQLINPATQSVLSVDEPVVSGENEFKLNVAPFNRGLYILTLTQGGQRISRKVLLSE